MKLEVRDPGENVLAEVEFDIAPGGERRVEISSSTGGTIHAFQDSTPIIVVRVPAIVEGEDAPVNNVAHISEVTHAYTTDTQKRMDDIVAEQKPPDEPPPVEEVPPPEEPPPAEEPAPSGETVEAGSGLKF